MTTQLLPPRISIEQISATVSATIRQPILRLCLIGPCKQLLDVTTSSGAINSDALAGTYSGNAKSFSYPNQLTYSEIITTSVKVYFRFGNASTLTLLDSNEYYATTDTVTVSGSAQGVVAGGTTKVDVYIQYEALRLDVAPESDVNLNGTKTGISIQESSDISSNLATLYNDTRNPLTLAAFIAKQNAPNTEVLCVGIDEVSTNAPYGTAAAYTRALEFVEKLDVYSVVPLSQESNIIALMPAHVTSMSSANLGKWRIGIVSSEMPSTSANETQASGSYGRIVTASSFDTGGDLSTVTAGDMITIVNVGTYEVQSVSGTTVNLTTSPLNIADTTDKVWSIYTPGSTLTNRTTVATAYAAIGESIANRRILDVVPDVVEVTVSGVTYELPGFYGAAAVGAMIGEFKPQIPLSNYPIAGITSLDGSNDYFTPTQLNYIAGGGMYILVQEGSGALPHCRHQLTTDVSSIETRELSIVKAVDYYSKALKRALDNVVGKHVITDEFLNLRIAPIITGLSDSMVEGGIINGYTLTSIRQSATQPDTVEVTINVDPAYPCNTIDITLVV